MSIDFQTISSIVGIVAGVLGAIGSATWKSYSDKNQKSDRESIQETARQRLTEITISVPGIVASYHTDRGAEPQKQVANRLLKEVKQGIVEGISESSGLSKEQVLHEVEERISEVRERLANVEKRFPDDATIDKIASINDALFAQRIEQLAARIDKLEEKLLTKWDVALIVSLVVAGIFAIVGATYAVLKVIAHGI